MKKNERFVIIGGNAAGMSAASRIRRNLPEAEIIVFEESGDVSYGACGLPYYISNDIPESERLIAISADDFRQKRNIDVRLHHRAVSFDPRKKTIELYSSTENNQEQISYDKLIIATGARSVKPPIDGIDLDNVFTLRTLQDGIRIKDSLDAKNHKNAIIVGGGYIGLEMAEALHKHGLKVTVVEMLDRLMPNVDTDISALVEEELHSKGCAVYKSNAVEEIMGGSAVERVRLSDGTVLPADILVIAAGVKPNVEFALSGGVQLGGTGAIAVSSTMRTNVHNVFAAGDCAEAKNLVTGKNDYIPLGTTANKQGRIAGDNASGKASKFAGIVGTAAVKVFDLEIARTGICSATAKKLYPSAQSILIKSKSRAGYYPNPQKITVKLIFRPEDGRLLGAQMAGGEGVAKRIDVLATALHQRMSVQDIVELDLSYAPPFAPVWDPILVAANQATKLVRK
ncbi:MAG TPA: CoA-disulfide reductase [Caldithrix abyssi]|uniref:CoA-disulfide reductase n=1 Tax=Caldithrix abyssi TaxID=187145 RepID=A0A7V4WX89_CALAY|nr:CoA-disulfide reductase [Caldithrix abyssi]